MTEEQIASKDELFCLKDGENNKTTEPKTNEADIEKEEASLVQKWKNNEMSDKEMLDLGFKFVRYKQYHRTDGKNAALYSLGAMTLGYWATAMIIAAGAIITKKPTNGDGFYKVINGVSSIVGACCGCITFNSMVKSDKLDVDKIVAVITPSNKHVNLN